MTANATVEEPVKILDLNLEKESNTTRTKREVVEEEEEGTEDETEEKCRVDMWRCLSKVSYQSFLRHFSKRWVDGGSRISGRNLNFTNV